MVADYLRASALYRGQVAEIWQWRNWAQHVLIDQTDIGIDLVVRTHDNEYWTGVRFSLRLIVATTPNWSKHAESALARREPPYPNLIQLITMILNLFVSDK